MLRTTLKCALWVATANIVVAHAQTPNAAPSPMATSAAAPAAPAQARARGPSLGLAVEAAQVAFATCLANGYKTSVLIVDSAGVPVVLFSGDGATERTQSIAASKAAAVVRYHMSSGEVTTRAAADPAMDAQIKADAKIGMARQGALMLKAGNDMIGAIAVSGAPGGEKDEVCSQAGLDKIKDRLR